METKVYGRKDMVERNALIVIAVLNGTTLTATAKKHGLTPERIRQIVSKYCRTANKKWYTRMPECKTVNIEWIRQYKKAFIDME